MIKIILDTSNQYLVVALYKDEECLGKIQELGSQRQSENAIPYLQKLLDKNHIELLAVDEAVITIGPGSYTGVRVAMTIVKTLSVITSLKVKAISSLKAYAGYEKCISVIDARSKKVFVCIYEDGQAKMKETLMTIEEFKQLREEYKDYKVVGQTQVVGEEFVEVDLADNLYLLSANEPDVENIDALVPRYLKDVEAKKICL